MFDVLLIELLPFAKILFSGLSSPVFWYWPDIWYMNLSQVDIIQIKFDFYCLWPDCTPDIFFCFDLVFRTFLCGLARYWHQIWGINLYWYNTENFFTFVSFHVFSLELCLFEIFFGPVGDMYCFSNTYSMLVLYLFGLVGTVLLEYLFLFRILV